MIDASLTIRTAYYNALNNIVFLNGNPVPFYDRVPSNPAYPYIYNTDYTAVEDRSKELFGYDCTMTLKVTSKYTANSGGQADNDTITSQVLNLIVGTKPGQAVLSFAPNFVNAVTTLVMTNSLQELVPDGIVFYRIIKIRHIIMQYSQ